MAAEPARPEPVLRNGRGHSSERPAYRKKIIIIKMKKNKLQTGKGSSMLLAQRTRLPD